MKAFQNIMNENQDVLEKTEVVAAEQKAPKKPTISS